MYRFIGLMGIIFFCTLSGYYFSMEMWKRIQSLKELKRMVELLKGEIRYGRTPLDEAFIEVAEHGREPFRKIFRNVAKDMRKRDGRTLRMIFQECTNGIKRGTGLKEEDFHQFFQMGGRLGYLDMEMQMRTIDFYLEELEKTCAMAEEEYRGKGKLYRNLGFMGGLFLAIVLM